MTGRDLASKSELLSEQHCCHSEIHQPDLHRHSSADNTVRYSLDVTFLWGASRLQEGGGPRISSVFSGWPSSCSSRARQSKITFEANKNGSDGIPRVLSHSNRGVPGVYPSLHPSRLWFAGKRCITGKQMVPGLNRRPCSDRFAEGVGVCTWCD